MTFFSVLIPIYNVEKYLTKCLDSVLHQTFQEFEIIAIDDGSKDNSGLILDSYKDRFQSIRIIHRENKGLYQTRLEQIQMANGDYLLFLDSDDELDVNALSILFEAINNNNPDIIIFSNYIINMTGSIVKTHGGFIDTDKFDSGFKVDLFKKLLTTYDISVVWQKCVKRQILVDEIDLLRTFTGVNMGEDKIWSSCMFSKFNKGLYIDKPLYLFRQSDDSLTAIIKPVYVDDFVKVREAMRLFIDKSFMCSMDMVFIDKLFYNRFFKGFIWYLYQMLRNKNVNKDEYSKIYSKIATYFEDNIIQFKGKVPIHYWFAFKFLNPTNYILAKKISNRRRSSRRI